MSAVHSRVDERRASRLKLAELTSSVGAGILGAGIGVLLTDLLGGLGVPILVLGLVLHAWGMRDKHRFEAGAPEPPWSVALYWICWITLAALGLYVLIRALGAS